MNAETLAGKAGIQPEVDTVKANIRQAVETWRANYVDETRGRSRYRSQHLTSIELGASWATREAHSMHGLVPRLGGFPPAFAAWVIDRYSNEGDVILDPFAGKGTAPFEALIAERHAFASDAAPEAFVITNAKLAGVDHERAARLLDRIQLRGSNSLSEVPPEVRVFFHDETLSQILELRDKLFRILDISPGGIFGLSSSALSDTQQIAGYILACLLGCLHGPVSWSTNKQASRHASDRVSVYLSAHCHHTYSASPSYVRTYLARYGLTPPYRDVKASILKKSGLAQLDALPRLVGNVSCTLAQRLDRRRRVDLILTSPPYFRSQSYAWDNWLRLWLLGYADYRSVAKSLTHTQNVERYYTTMRICLERMHAVLRPGACAVIVVGDVRMKYSGRTHAFMADDCRTRRYVFQDDKSGYRINTSEVICDAAVSVGFSVDSVINDSIPRGNRALASSLRPQQGTDIDRAVVLRRGV